MVVQDMTVRLNDPTQVITIEAKDSRREMETNAYLCNRLLHTVEKITADNIRITVSEKAFENIKNYLGQ